jgi:hypothetical protein
MVLCPWLDFARPPCKGRDPRATFAHCSLGSTEWRIARIWINVLPGSVVSSVLSLIPNSRTLSMMSPRRASSSTIESANFAVIVMPTGQNGR